MLSILLASALALAGCGTDDDTGTTTTTAGDDESSEGAAEVSIEMVDYSFVVSKGPLVLGGSIAASNTGKELHMIAASKLKDGKTIDDINAALAAEAEGPPEGEEEAEAAQPEGEEGGEEGEGEGEDPFAEIFEEDKEFGFAISPGESYTITGLEMEAGTYGLLCFVPTEGEGMPHAAKGMVGTLEVVEGEAPPAPTPTATLSLGDGKAEAPDGIKAGPNVIELKTEGGAHEGIFSRLDPGKTFQDFDAYFDKEYEAEAGPGKGAAEKGPGDLVAFLFDYEGSVFLEMDLKAGNYSFACGLHSDEEDEDSPRHFEQGELANFTVT